MKVTQATIKRLVETGAADDVTNKENFYRDINSTILYYSVGTNGVNAPTLETSTPAPMDFNDPWVAFFEPD